MPATRRVEFCFVLKSLLYICLFEDKGTNNHNAEGSVSVCTTSLRQNPWQESCGEDESLCLVVSEVTVQCGGKGRVGQLSPWQQEDEVEQSCSHSSSPRNEECWRELEVGANVQRPPTPIYFCHLPQSPIASPNSTTS